MTTETTVVETVTKTPSKIAILKSKLTREGLILGGIVTGIIIAGGLAILSSSSDELDEDSDLDESFDTDDSLES